MHGNTTSLAEDAPQPSAPGPQSPGSNPRGGWYWIDALGRATIRSAGTSRRLTSFCLITLGVVWSRRGHARALMRPKFRAELHRSGVTLLPMISLLALVLGLVIIGQTAALLSKVGAQTFLGTVMITVVVRELGPLLTAMLVLARVGTAYVIELGTARALGEVEALEALRVDPIHFLVLPKVAALAVSVFALTVYFVIIALVGGYLFAFLREVPMLPGEYFKQLAEAAAWKDFLFLAIKTSTFGVLIGVVSCFEGLSRPLRLGDVSHATTRAVVNSVAGLFVLDAIFLILALFL